LQPGIKSSRPEQMPLNIDAVTMKLPAEFWNALKDAQIIDPGYNIIILKS